MTDPLREERVAIEQGARLQDALDALQTAVLWHGGHVGKPSESWSRNARSGVVGLVAALASPAVPRPEGLTPDRLSEAMDEAFEYVGDSSDGKPVLPFVDDFEAFWDPFAAKVLARLASEPT